MILKSDGKFEEKWLMVWKMTLEIWQIFTRALKNLKIGAFMGSFCTKYKMYELKIYRGVMFHDNEEWWKIWRGIDLSIQHWHEQFDELWPEHSKISNICTLMGCFWPKNIIFELKKYRGVIFHGTEEWFKIRRKIDLWFGKWDEELGKFLTEHSKVSKLELWWDSFIQTRKYMNVKFIVELCVMIMKIDKNLDKNW